MGKSVIKLVGALASLNKKSQLDFKVSSCQCVWDVRVMTQAACGCWKPRLPSHPNLMTLCSVNSLHWPRHHEIAAFMSFPRMLLTRWFIALWWRSDTAERSFWQRCVQLQSLRYMHMFLWYLVARNAWQIWLFRESYASTFKQHAKCYLRQQLINPCAFDSSHLTQTLNPNTPNKSLIKRRFQCLES